MSDFDPNTVVEDLLELAYQIRIKEDGGVDVTKEALAMADKFEDLDHCLRRGEGFPNRWRKGVVLGQ